MSRYKAVLLDVDGTLIDSNDAHARAWVDVGSEFRHTIDFSHVRRLIGMGGDRVLPALTGLDEESDAGRAMLDRRGEIFREAYLPSLLPFRNVRPLLERLAAEGCTLVTASSASAKDLRALLTQAGVADLFDASTSSDDAAHSKPSPDIIEAALERVFCAPGEAIMIGDTPYDVAAALRASVACIAFRCGGWSDGDLEGAAEVYDGAWALLENYEASVLFRAR